MHFHYNISYLSEREKILAAEFHVFKMRPAPPKFKESKPPYVIEVIYNCPHFLTNKCEILALLFNFLLCYLS